MARRCSLTNIPNSLGSERTLWLPLSVRSTSMIGRQKVPKVSAKDYVLVEVELTAIGYLQKAEAGILLKYKPNEYRWQGTMKALEFDENGNLLQKVPQPSKPTWVSVQDVVLNSLRPSTQPSQLLPELSHFYTHTQATRRCLAHVAMVLVGVSRLDTK